MRPDVTFLNTTEAASNHWNYLFIGAGHNGLVCANYIARRFPKRTILMLERRHLLGGAALSEEVFPGYTFSRFSYVFSIFRPKIIKELFPAQWREELVLHKNDPYLFVPGQTKGDFLLLSSSDVQHSTHSLTQFASVDDARAYYKFIAMLYDFHRLIDPLLDTTPATSILQALQAAPSLRLPKQYSISELLAFVTTSSATVLNQWFTSNRLKAGLAYSGTVGQMLSPYSAGSAFLQLHHVANTLGDETGKHRYYPKGGMGAVSAYLARLAQHKSVAMANRAEVASINVDNGAACGVTLADGKKIHADTVISNCTYDVTFNKMLDETDRAALPEQFRRSLASISYETNCSKLNLVLTDLPRFTALDGLIDYNAPFEQKRMQACRYLHHTLIVGEHMDDMHNNFLAATQGELPEEPTIQMLMPSLLDDGLTPEGSTDIVVLLFVQYTPYRLASGWNETSKAQLLERAVKRIECYAPGFGDLIKHADIVTPVDIEAIVGLTGGNIFQGAMSLDNMYSTRPIANWSQYKTPVKSLFSCSAASHPGGGVCGGSGRNAAREIIKATR